ncbi:hypothetical protein ACHQM5_027653 [Ranunculus cassubicifolius]
MEEINRFNFTLKKHRITITTRIKCITCSSSYSSTSINDLDDDTMLEIIGRLSIKHMIRSKSVSKLWYRLISDICNPNMLHALLFNHFIRPPPVREIRPWSFVSLKSPNRHKITHLTELCSFLPYVPTPNEFLDCSNGFVLLFCESLDSFYVCNPSTEQYLVIPRYKSHKGIPRSGVLIFDPQCKIMNIHLSKPLIMDMISTETGEWNVHTLPIDSAVNEKSIIKRYIYSDGSVYMLAKSGQLLKFGIKQVGVQAIELPKVVMRNRPIGNIGMFQGRLHYAWDDAESQMFVWILSEGVHGHDWVVKYTMCHKYFIEHPLCSNLDDASMFMVYAFDPASDVLFVGNFTGMYQYDPRTERLECLFRLKDGKFILACMYFVYPFWPNLSTMEALSQRAIASIQSPGNNIICFPSATLIFCLDV